MAGKKMKVMILAVFSVKSFNIFKIFEIHSWIAAQTQLLWWQLLMVTIVQDHSRCTSLNN